MSADGGTAGERIHQRHEAARMLWWWRIPYLAILAVAVAVLWIFISGVPGAIVGAGVTGLGIWVATLNPWARRND